MWEGSEKQKEKASEIFWQERSFKSDREGEISYDIPYVQNQKRNDTN